MNSIKSIRIVKGLGKVRSLSLGQPCEGNPGHPSYTGHEFYFINLPSYTKGYPNIV